MEEDQTSNSIIVFILLFPNYIQIMFGFPSLTITNQDSISSVTQKLEHFFSFG